MSELTNYKIEPCEHQRLSDNENTPLREEPAASPRIYTSNTTAWESDNGETTTVIPKKESGMECDPSPDVNFFDDLMHSSPILKDLKAEKPVDLYIAADSANLDNLPNGFAKRELLDDMDLETEPFADSNLQVLLEQRTKLLEEHQLLVGQEKRSSSSANKKRKRHEKEKRNRHHRSRDKKAEEGSKRSRKSFSPSRDEELRRSNNSQEKERPRAFESRHSTNNDEGRDRMQITALESRRPANSDEENRTPRRKSLSPPRDLEFMYSNYSRDERFREEPSKNNEDERNCQKIRRSFSQSPQRQGYHESKRCQVYSRLPNAIPHRVIIKEEPDLEPPRLRDDEKGCIRLVDPSKLMQEIPEPSRSSLSYEEKRKLGIERATLALAKLQLESSKTSRDEILMVNTISKLPVGASYMTQGIFENPSPLQNNFNVSYKFNSICGAEIDLTKWGLEELPASTAHLLNLFGFDVDTLKKIEANTVTPQHILKLRKTATENGDIVIKTEDLISTGTNLFKNMSTQTTFTTNTCTTTVGTQTKPMKESPEYATFWQDPRFDTLFLTQTQTNIMFGLKELTETMPNAMWAEQFYKALQNALFIKRMAHKDPRLSKNDIK